MKQPTILSSEQRYTTRLSAVFFVCLLSGFSTYLISLHDTWSQWTYLVHTFFGILLSILLIPYIIIHFRRTLGYRRPGVIFTGLILLSVFMCLVLTGLHITFFGQMEALHWIYASHVIAAEVCVVLIILHLFLHWRFFPEKRRKANETRFLSIENKLFRTVFGTTVISISIIVILTIAYNRLPTPYTDEPVVKDYTYEYGDHPFRPSQTETYHQKFIDPAQIATSQDCASCHADIAKQWSSSAHKLAASDPTYVTNVSLLADNKGIAATRYCEGCHAPVALLTGELSEGGLHGGIEGTLGNKEGVGCMGCHGINRAVHLKGVASYEYKPAEDYLFTGFDTETIKKLSHYLIKLKPEQHKTDMSRAILSTPQQCATCHTQFMDKDMNNWGWVKMQDEYGAWLNSPYSQQSEQTFSHTKVTRCQDCHMPLTNGNDPSANKDGQFRSHRFPGANTMLAFVHNDLEQFKMTKKFLQSGKIRVNIEEPRRADAVRTHQALDEEIRTRTETPYYLYLGETTQIRVVVTNQGVGHNFPGGTIDINEAWLAFTVTDASNQIVYQSGQLMANNSVDPNAHFYRSQPVDRQGKLVWKHDLFNRVGEAYKNVIPAGKSDIVVYELTIPDWAKNPLLISTTLRYRKLNDRYARWALKDKYQALPIVDMARDSLIVPVKIKPELQTEKM